MVKLLLLFKDAFSDFGLSFDGLIACIGLILFAFLGLENASTAGDEITHAKRDLPYAAFRTSALAIVLYGFSILAVLFVLPIILTVSVVVRTSVLVTLSTPVIL